MKRLILSLLSLPLLAGAALAQDDVVRMGTEGAYPPYNFINDNGEVYGFERHLGDELCERAELNCVWVTNEWDSIIPNLVSGNYDTIIAGMSITPAREEVIDFTEAYIPPAPSSYLAMAGMNPDLENGVIAAQAGTVQADFVADSGATLVEYATPEETVAAVRNGEVDAVLADKAFVEPVANESGGQMVLVEDVRIGGGIGMGLRSSNDELRGQFNEVIVEMKQDGSLNELLVQWFGDEADTW